METTFDATSSILDSVKKVCGISDDYDVFDQDLLIFINGVILELTQNGIGPEKGFIVTDSTSLWHDFLDDFPNPGAVATYISLKVKILFDPPSSSFVIDAYKKQLDELIWRLNIEADK